MLHQFIMICGGPCTNSTQSQPFSDHQWFNGHNLAMPLAKIFFHFLLGVSAIEVGSVTLVGQPRAGSKEPTKRDKRSIEWIQSSPNKLLYG